MSDQLFAFLLVMQGLLIAVGMLWYFFFMRREALSILSALVNVLFAYFFWLLGGGVKEPAQAILYIRATAYGLLFAQFAMIVFLLYHAVVGYRGSGKQ